MMKNVSIKCCSFIGAIALLSLQCLNADDEFTYKVRNDFYIQNNDVSGVGASSSTLTSGSLYYNVFSLYAKGDMDDLKYKINLGVKLTNDEKKDKKKASLSNLSGTVMQKDHALYLGDYLKSFSKYSMNSSLKGAAYSYDNKVDKFDLLYGIAYARWDSFWDNETDSTRRDVYGVRYSRKISNHQVNPLYQSK